MSARRRPGSSGRARLSLALPVLAGAVLLAPCARTAPEPPRFANLVLVVIDTLRSDHLAAYGYDRPTAPFLDRLASEGIRLQGSAASSWTKPSVATLLTGLHPQRHQANTRAARLPAALPFLPEILRRHGYSTLGYTGNWFTGPSFGFDRGFDRFLEVWPPEPLRAAMYRNPASPDKPHASWATDSALDLVAGVRSPFFLSVHYLDPHDPYTPPAAWGREPAAPGDFVQPGDLQPWTAEREQIDQLIDQYDAVIREVDGEVRRLLEGLGAGSLLERTLVVVTSDHGEEFLEHGNLTHGKTLFEEVLQVPLLFWSDEGVEPRGWEAPFHHVDLLPTVLQALGLEVPADLDGVGRWRDLAAGNPPAPRGAAPPAAPPEDLHHLDLDGNGVLAIVSPPWKLIHQKRARAREGEATATNLLFRLAEDPRERVHREGDAAVREDLLRRLIARHNGLADTAAAVAPGTAEPALFDADLRRDLAGLGYLDASTPQEELERRSIPDRLRFFDARTWGLFAGGGAGLVSSVSAGGDEVARQIARLPRGVASSGPDRALHWVLLRSAGATGVTVAGEIAPGIRRVSCRLALDGVAAVTELTSGPFDWRVPLASGPGAAGRVYVDLSCTAAAGGDALHGFSRLAVRVD